MARDSIGGALVGALERVAKHRYRIAAIVAALIGWAHRGDNLPDYLQFARAGGHIWSGGWGGIYGDPSLQAGPVQLALLGAFRSLRHLHRGLDVEALNVVGDVLLTVGLMRAGGLLRRYVGNGRAPLAELVVGMLAVAFGWVGEPTALSHPAEILVPCFWLAGAVALRRDRPGRAGLLLAAATGFEIWALLGLGVVLLARRPRSAARCLAAAAIGTAVVWLPFVAAGPFRMLDLRWGVRSGTAVAAVFGGTAFTASMRIAQLGAAVAAAGVVAVLTRRSPHSVWLVPTAAVVVRLGLDPVQYDYYWLPALTLMLLVLVATASATAAVRPLCVVVALLTYGQAIAFGGVLKTSMVAASLVLLAGAVRLVRAEGAGGAEDEDLAAGQHADGPRSQQAVLMPTS